MWKSVLLWIAKALGQAAIEKAADKLSDPKKPTNEPV